MIFFIGIWGDKLHYFREQGITDPTWGPHLSIGSFFSKPDIASTAMLIYYSYNAYIFVLICGE